MTDIAESREIDIVSEGHRLAGRFFPPRGQPARILSFTAQRVFRRAIIAPSPYGRPVRASVS